WWIARFRWVSRVWNQEGRPAPASGTCEQFALLRNRIADPRLVATQVSDRLKAESMQGGGTKPFERGQVLRCPVPLIVLETILREDDIPSLERRIPGDFRQDGSGGDRKTQRVAVNQRFLRQGQVE